jgi:hypothetical protein
VSGFVSGVLKPGSVSRLGVSTANDGDVAVKRMSRQVMQADVKRIRDMM